MQPTAAPSATPTLAVGSQQTAQAASLRVNTQYPNTASGLAAAVTQFQTDVGSALGIDHSRVQVTGTANGSIVFSFLILPALTQSATSPAQALSLLQAQLANSSAPIYQGMLTSNANASLTVLPAVVLQLCADNSWSAPGTCAGATSVAPGSSDGGSSMPIIIGAAIGGVALIAVVAIVVSKCANSSKQQQQQVRISHRFG